MTDRDHERRREEEPPEPGVEGGTGPGVSPGDVETPGAATTPNLPDEGDGEDGEHAEGAPDADDAPGG